VKRDYNYDPATNQCRRKNKNVPDKAARWALRPRLFCSYQVSGAQNIHNSDSGKCMNCVWLLVLCVFQILIKPENLYCKNDPPSSYQTKNVLEWTSVI